MKTQIYMQVLTAVVLAQTKRSGCHKAPGISLVYSRSAARWLQQEPFTLLIWPQLPVPQKQWKQVNKSIKTHAEYIFCWLSVTNISLKPFYPLNGYSNTQQRQEIKTNCSGEANRKPEREALIFLVTISFMKEKKILFYPSQGCSQWVLTTLAQTYHIGHKKHTSARGSLKIWTKSYGCSWPAPFSCNLSVDQPDIRSPNKANPFTDFTSGNRISWGFLVLQGSSYLSNSSLWRPGFTATPGVCGLGWSFGVASVCKRKLNLAFFFTWPLTYFTVCLRLQSS